MTGSVPVREECVLRYVLDRWADERPDQIFARFENGSQWSFAETRKRIRRLGAALQTLGVTQGDHVVVWLPNGKKALGAYFAIGYIGAVYVPINTAYIGDLLAHVIGNAGPRLIIAHRDLVPRLAEIDAAALDTAVTVGTAAVRAPNLPGAGPASIDPTASPKGPVG